MTNPRINDGKNCFVWAHRGASAVAPENTMSAFRIAEETGADGVELDVHLSRDGVPVVIHDDTLHRTTNGIGQVSRKTAGELLSLDAGSWFGVDFSGEQVPLLAEVLEWAGDRLRINIEIKDAAAGQAVLSTLGDFPSANILLSSFNSKLLFRINQQTPDQPIGFLLDSRFWRRAVNLALACRAESFHPAQKHVHRLLVNACHQNNLAVYPWTVDSPDRIAGLQRIGIDGYFTNRP